jgi:DNA-binding transcriptional LysR family regulator
MNLHHLRYARSVMETRSFSRAAEQCHVSQPSLSIAVAQLEQELGEPLFLRSTRRVEPTPFGAYLAPFLEEAVRGLDEVRLAAARFRGSSETVVRMGLSPLIDARLLKGVIEPFERKWPGGTVIFKECMIEDLQQRLAAQGIDIACTVREGRPRTGFCPLYSDTLLYLPQGGQRRSAGHPVPIRELASETFVLTVDGCGLTNAIRRLFHRNKVRLREYAGHALSYDVVEEWVELGIGAGILPESKVNKLKQSARPIVQNSGQLAKLGYEFRWNERRQMPDHVAAFIEHLRSAVPKLVRGAVWGSTRR